MAIASSDIKYRLTVKTGVAGEAATSTPAGSLGKYASTTDLVDATLDNLFDDVSGDENAASDVEYRCFFVHNNHASITWENVKVWISSETAGGASAAIGLDPAGVSAKGAAVAQAATIVNEDTAPAGVVFTAPTTKSTGLTIGDIAAGSVAAIWIRRTAANSAALDTDGVVIRCEGDTAA